MMIQIREAVKEDTPTIHELGKGVDEFHTSDQAPNFWPEKILQNCIGKDDVYLLVAEVDHEIVGFIVANLNKSLSKTLIENIFVKPDFRGRRIGSNLVARIVELAKAQQYQFVSVLTPPDDIGAIKTYEKAGFVKGETFLWLDIA